MKKKISLLFFCLLSSIFLLQAEAQQLSEQQEESITNEINAFFQEMLGYAEKLDYEKISSTVDDRHKAGFITNKKYYQKYAALIDDFKTNTGTVSNQEITIKEQKTTVLSDKIVLMTVVGIANVKLNDGRIFSNNFHWSFVYEKIDNEWKVIHSHQSLVN